MSWLGSRGEAAPLHPFVLVSRASSRPLLGLLTDNRWGGGVRYGREELQQPVFSATDELEFPELHDESIPCIALLHHLSLLMGAAGVKDFGLKVKLLCSSDPCGLVLSPGRDGGTHPSRHGPATA